MAAPTASVFRQHFVAILVASVVLVIAVAALAVWLLTSVASSTLMSTTASSTSSEVPQASAQPEAGSSTGLTSEDRQYLGMLRALPEVPAVTNPTSMIAAGHGICSDLGRGVGAGAEMDSIAGQTQLSTNAAGEIVGAAIMSYCPEYRTAAGI